MERGQFTFYRSFWEAVKALPPKDRNAVLNAICAYALDGEEPRLSGVQNSIFILVRPTLDTSARKAENGKVGGSKAEANAKQTESKTEAKRKQTESEKEKEGEIEKEGEKEIEIENECYIKARNNTRFVRPTLDEVKAYCAERHNGVDAERWMAYYEANGWKVGKNAMKDWRAAVRTWENNGYSTGKPAQQGAARAEDDPRMAEKLDAMRRMNAALKGAGE